MGQQGGKKKKKKKEESFENRVENVAMMYVYVYISVCV